LILTLINFQMIFHLSNELQIHSSEHLCQKLTLSLSKKHQAIHFDEISSHYYLSKVSANSQI
jgi:hypothetical protein